MNRASVDDQLRLLALQQLDTALAQLDARRRRLPEAVRAAELQAREAALDADRVASATRLADLDREVARAEREVDQVRTRADRDRVRLAAGTASAKDLVGLQHEVQSLAARQSALEDVELEVMERREAEADVLAGVTEQLGAVREELATATAERDRAMAAVMAAGRAALAERAAVAPTIDAALVTRYERIRAGRDGVGVARLVGGRCQGCHLDLPGSDLARIAATAPEELVTCEECGRLLVRVD